MQMELMHFKNPRDIELPRFLTLLEVYFNPKRNTFVNTKS